MDLLWNTWNSLKIWRSFRLGPVSLVFRFCRTIHVSKNRSARPWAQPHRHSDGPDPVLRPLAAKLSASTAEANGSRPITAQSEVAMIFGVGPGLGFALARKLVSCGDRVALVSRQAHNLQGLAETLNTESYNGRATVYSCDATDERGVREVFELTSRQFGIPTLVIFTMQNTVPGRAIDITTDAFEDCWRTNCLAGFIVAREAARMMRAGQKGSIILIGSTSGLIGREDHLTHAVGKFGLRAVSQVMARELWKDGLHLAHVVIDATIDEPSVEEDSTPKSDPMDLAEAIYAIHCQRKGAWTSEVDLRTWNIRFWEHC